MQLGGLFEIRDLNRDPTQEDNSNSNPDPRKPAYTMRKILNCFLTAGSHGLGSEALEEVRGAGQDSAIRWRSRS